jgi:hypothetical protein
MRCRGYFAKYARGHRLDDGGRTAGNFPMKLELGESLKEPPAFNVGERR